MYFLHLHKGVLHQLRKKSFFDTHRHGVFIHLPPRKSDQLCSVFFYLPPAGGQVLFWGGKWIKTPWPLVAKVLRLSQLSPNLGPYIKTFISRWLPDRSHFLALLSISFGLKNGQKLTKLQKLFFIFSNS